MVVENLSSGHDLLGGTVTELFDLLIGVVVDERAPVGLDVLFVARALNIVAISLDDVSSDRQRCQEEDEGPNHDFLCSRKFCEGIVICICRLFCFQYEGS